MLGIDFGPVAEKCVSDFKLSVLFRFISLSISLSLALYRL